MLINKGLKSKEYKMKSKASSKLSKQEIFKLYSSNNSFSSIIFLYFLFSSLFTLEHIHVINRLIILLELF